MKKTQLSLLSLAIAAASVGGSQQILAEGITEALTGGKAYGDFRLRYETVDQDIYLSIVS